ncbi:hypothetical protein [Methylobacter sp. BBA5.1]|uniref:hypothetical protein n=1 Tax=Methylobacter sp. BBA5.1 TaxID=1495064 RepID=UPI000690BD88|nr:hypothetical protein [Methylobacter sp. BBA5.1]
MRFAQSSDKQDKGFKTIRHYQAAGICLPLLAMALAHAGPAQANCTNTVSADVVALDQVFYYNRLGAMNPAGMVFALKADVVDLAGGPNPGPGNAMLRPGKRPRPLTLRVNEGDCLQVRFSNWLSPTLTGSLQQPVRPSDPPNSTPVRNDDGPATRTASFHVMGLQPQDILSDASNVGNNPSGLAAPGESLTYTFYAGREGTFLAYSTAATTGGEGDGGSLAHGLFGAVNVENNGAEWYRSQVTEQDLALAATASTLSEADGQYYPVIDYDAVYPDVETRKPQEVLTLISTLDSAYQATLSRLTSDTGFTAGDQGKTLITPEFSGIITTVNADGSAIVEMNATTAEKSDDSARNKNDSANRRRDSSDDNSASSSSSAAVVSQQAAPYTWRIEGTAPHPLAGRPILRLLDSGRQIVHSDLNAIITGPNRGKFSSAAEPKNAVYPDRQDPFREFTVVFHDEIKAVQAFPDWFNDPVLGHTLHGVRDGFGINYGTGGVGSEIIANRLGLGPMKDCLECKYEEFFLTSWVLGDPALVVDVPAGVNADGRMGVVANPLFATRAFFPDDPSNVHHSYLNDRVKFRNLHAGPKEHHIFHLHAHQWLHTPDSDESAYLDSQSIGPGGGYTYEIAHHGSGNRNRTAGDSIFHCHFYPHFAQGMWEFWRVHDVLETGTVLDADGRPAPGARALPDQEIKAGTPIPAVVPLPTLALAPQPGAKVVIEDGQVKLPEVAAGNPGYPFYIAGIAGHRPPQPPMDLVEDGGLPRHVVTGGTATSVQTRLDFSKTIDTLSAIKLPGNGTLWERQAMIFHGGDGVTPGPKSYSTPKPEGGTGLFKVNGLPARPGAPYADPCVSDDQQPTGSDRFYHAAAIQMDAKFNKVGWHFPQQRILTLWEDVKDTVDQVRPPEPLFFRANTGECITFRHTNLVPNVYQQDDFQVTTPTDTIGQHIHLVKFDVTSSDGSGNGWNYEDGTFSPEEVHERLAAINNQAGEWLEPTGEQADKPPVCTLGDFQRGDGSCVQTTVQRWYADDVLNNAGQGRSLRTVFTHDHFGPSTHQHPGLYAGLVVEPPGSTWKHNETGTLLSGRADGGPTSWQAIIEPGNGDEAYREFLLEMGDFSLAYRSDGTPVNPPGKKEAGLHDLVEVAPTCPGGATRPCPEAISADDPGTMTVNYRHEPIALRVNNGANVQTPGRAGDLSFAFESRTDRAIAALNRQPDFFSWPLTQDILPGDPFTPMLKAYAGDKVQIRVLMGAHEEGHNFGAHGLKWLFEPSLKDSGYRSSQMLGISEHFEFELQAVDTVQPGTPWADLAYFPGAATDDIWNGLWGIMRTYNGKGNFSPQFPKPTLAKLPSNPDGVALPPMNCAGGKKNNPNCPGMNGVCPTNAPQTRFTVHAFLAKDLLDGPLVYNQRAGLEDPGAILFVRDADLDPKNKRLKLKPGVPVEPLILRANAGDCITLELFNHLPENLGSTQKDGWSTLPMIVEGFNNNDILPSSHVGLTPQLLEFDLLTGSGLSVGQNWTLPGGNFAAAAPGKSVSYKWYAGRMTIRNDPNAQSNPQRRFAEPVEYGAVNLMSSDRIKHASKGAIGALIIEPQGAKWQEDASSRASATVTLKSGNDSFREHVLIFQDDLNLQQDGVPIPNLADSEDPEDSGQRAFNYRTEPMWTRTGFAADEPLENTRGYDFSNILTGASETPTFTAKAGEPVRLRVLHPGGHPRNHVFQLHGHGWPEEPYTDGSTVMAQNNWSEWKGAQDGIGPGSSLNLLLTNGAGGVFATPGDYLYRDQASFQFDGGLWGVFHVE